MTHNPHCDINKEQPDEREPGLLERLLEESEAVFQHEMTKWQVEAHKEMFRYQVRMTDWAAQCLRDGDIESDIDLALAIDYEKKYKSMRSDRDEQKEKLTEEKKWRDEAIHLHCATVGPLPPF